MVRAVPENNVQRGETQYFFRPPYLVQDFVLDPLQPVQEKNKKFGVLVQVKYPVPTVNYQYPALFYLFST